MKKMRHFLTFALIAALLFGAVDVNAKTKRRKTNPTKKTKTTKSKKTEDSIDDIIDLDFFQKIVKEANKNTPMDEGDGLVLTSITMKGKTIYYDTDVYDPEIIESMKEMPSLFESFMKGYMAKHMNQEFSSIEYGDLVVDQMAKLGILICLRFHEQGKSSTLATVTITAKEMKAAALGY